MIEDKGQMLGKRGTLAQGGQELRLIFVSNNPIAREI